MGYQILYYITIPIGWCSCLKYHVECRLGSHRMGGGWTRHIGTVELIFYDPLNMQNNKQTRPKTKTTTVKSTENEMGMCSSSHVVRLKAHNVSLFRRQ